MLVLHLTFSLFTGISLACSLHLLHMDSGLFTMSVVRLVHVHLYTSRVMHLHVGHTSPLASTVSIFITYGRRRGWPKYSSSELSLSTLLSTNKKTKLLVRLA